MSKKYRDPRREKIRDLRRAHGMWRKLCERLHPECNIWWMIRLDDRQLLDLWLKLCHKSKCSWWKVQMDDRQLWDLVNNAEDERIREFLGYPVYVPHSPGNAPAHYRRTMNKLRRAKDRQAMREQLRDGETDIVIPRHRRDVNWNWF